MVRLLLTRPAFRRLWLGTNISMLGDWLSLVAVSHYSLKHDSGALALAFTLVAHLLPRSLFSPVAGVLADRFDRRSVLLRVVAAQAVLTGLAVLSAASGVLVLLQALIALRSALSALDVPAQQAALRHVLRPDEYARGNAALATTWSVTFALGMAAGGLIAMWGAPIALMTDALTFVIAFAILRRLPSMPVAKATPGRGRSFSAVLERTFDSPKLFEATFAKGPIALMGGAGWIALNLVADELTVLGTAGLSLGLMQAVRGIGTGIGAWSLPNLRRRGMASPWIYALAMGLALTGMASLSTSSSSWVAGVMALVWGAGSGLNWVQSTTALQERVDGAVVGRHAALDQLSFTAMMSLSALLGATLGNGDPGRTGLVGLVLGGLGYAVWWARARTAPLARWRFAFSGGHRERAPRATARSRQGPACTMNASRLPPGPRNPATYTKPALSTDTPSASSLLPPPNRSCVHSALPFAAIFVT